MENQTAANVYSEPPRFDLDGYITNYAGRTRFERFMWIGCHSPHLAHDALKGAVLEAKKGQDTARYECAVATLSSISPHDPDASLDKEWVEKTTKRVRADTERFETELKGFKNNLIKESIRVGNEELGTHYLSIGNVSDSLKAFGRMRDFCTNTHHLVEMASNLIIVAVEQKNWVLVQSNVQKIRNIQQRTDDEAKLQPKLCAASGLAYLSQKDYHHAALSFIQAEANLGSSFNQVLSSNDVAVYGGLCALASMNRNELKKLVLESSSFRTYLELEPHIRQIISLFCNSKYGQSLAILEAYKNDYLLDFHLHGHVTELYYAIRTKCIVQYFIPFSCVTIDSMAKAFGASEVALEGELVDMIEMGALAARIDTQKRFLVSKRTDKRQAVHEQALELAKSYEQTARLRLMRINIVSAGLDLRATRGKEGNNALTDEFATSPTGSSFSPIQTGGAGSAAAGPVEGKKVVGKYKGLHTKS
ncbi:MAG: hypothetical protein M1829_001157 [Trizodia sp. TS-e1964]|nr:MAG: hypothetical protein M1829_001157 [Trizodia sp. TS-e1964]